MAEFPALTIWTDAFVADTTHLTREQVGVYILLLFTAWRRPTCDLPDDDKYLARVARCDGRKWRHLRPIMAQLHTVKDGVWTQDRLQKERKRARDLSKKQSENAHLRWSKIKGLPDAGAVPTQCHSDAPRPIPLVVSKKDKKVRASRWHPDCTVSLEWLDHAQQARRRHMLPDIDVELEGVKFANHWASAPGARGLKLDWHKTWINWILKAEGQRHGNGRKQTAHDSFFDGVADAIRETIGPAEDGGSNVVIGPFGRPLLPP